MDKLNSAPTPRFGYDDDPLQDALCAVEEVKRQRDDARRELEAMTRAFNVEEKESHKQAKRAEEAERELAVMEADRDVWRSLAPYIGPSAPL